MKNINHLFWGCVIVLLLSNFRINAQNLIGYADGNGYGAGIFTYPIEGSVIQRVGGNTNFNIMGHIGYGYQDATKYNYVIIAQELEPTTGNPKSPINVLTWNISITNVSSDLGFFNQYVNMPQGWWNLFLNISRKDGTGGTTLCTIKFGVGDIFVIAGQSNARGFTQEAGNPGLISYDNSMNDNGNFDAVRVFSVPSMSPVGTEGTLMALVYAP